MNKVAVAALSTSGLDAYPHPHNIHILRLHIRLADNDTDYIDGQNLSAADFQRWMLDNPNKMASTSPPDRNEIIRFFVNLMDKGYEEVIVITISA